MNGARHLVVFLITVFGLAACSSRSVDTELTRCVYPDSPRTPAPSFICQAAIPGFPLTVLRSSEPDDASVSDRIQSVFEDQVLQWSTAWSLEWFSEVDEQVRAKTYLLESLSEQARVVRSRVSPKGYLWLLVGLPRELSELKTATVEVVSFEP